MNRIILEEIFLLFNNTKIKKVIKKRIQEKKSPNSTYCSGSNLAPFIGNGTKVKMPSDIKPPLATCSFYNKGSG